MRGSSRPSSDAVAQHWEHADLKRRWNYDWIWAAGDLGPLKIVISQQSGVMYRRWCHTLHMEAHNLLRWSLAGIGIYAGASSVHQDQQAAVLSFRREIVHYSG